MRYHTKKQQTNKQKNTTMLVFFIIINFVIDKLFGNFLNTMLYMHGWRWHALNILLKKLWYACWPDLWQTRVNKTEAQANQDTQ